MRMRMHRSSTIATNVLMRAVCSAQGYPAGVKALLQAGADKFVNEGDPVNNRTPLIHATFMSTFYAFAELPPSLKLGGGGGGGFFCSFLSRSL